MEHLNVKYAHLEDTKLIDNVLLADRNPLAVELAKRFKHHIDHYEPDDTCEECGVEEDNLVSAEDRVKELERKLSEINDV